MPTIHWQTGMKEHFDTVVDLYRSLMNSPYHAEFNGRDMMIYEDDGCYNHDIADEGVGIVEL